MDEFHELGLDVKTFFNAKPIFVSSLLDVLKVPHFIDDAISAQKANGRNTEIPDGTIAKLLLINICDRHKPLYRLKEYFRDKDIQLLAGKQIESEQLHDDRFR